MRKFHVRFHMRKFHVRFLVGLMTVLGLCGGGIYLLHRVQMRRHASSLLDRARLPKPAAI
ncbi:MAG: hypothetical protein ABSH35_13415 [Isosphaeraceae bacterium]